MIVADTTTLVAMSLTQNLSAAKRLLGRITVGENTERQIRSVLEELAPDCEGPGDDIIEVVYIDISTPMLSRWETETVRLAREENAKLALTDDPVVRRELENVGVPAIGTVGLLYAGHRRGLIPDVRSDVDRLSHLGYGLSEECEEMLFEAIEEKSSSADTN